MNRIMTVVSIAFAGVTVASCSGSTSTGTTTGVDGGNHDSSTDAKAKAETGSDTGVGPTGTKACDDEAAALCSLRNSCAPGSYDIKLDFGTEAACQSRTAQTCVNALDAKGTGNTSEKVEACAAAYPGELCPNFFDSNPVMACVPPAGTLANGAACGASAQCVSTYCAVSQYTVCGTCQPLPMVGATCQVQADCGRDLACATPTVAVGDGGVPTSGQCAAWVGLGGSCLTGFNPCQEGNSCVGDDEATMTMGLCQAAGQAVDAPCDSSRKTMASCDNDIGLVCIPATKGSTIGTCMSVSLVGAGATCGDIGAAPITGFANCMSSGLCKKPAPTDATGTCVSAAADDAPCDNDPSIGPPCLSPSKCVVPSGSSGTKGTCTVPNAATCM
jgi:hypothetical protein